MSRFLLGGVLLLALSVSLQATDKSAFPSAARRVLEGMNVSLNKARQTAVDGLEVELKNSMKAGKLDDANAIKEEIDRLKVEMSSDDVGSKGRPTNDAELEAFIRGTNWRFEPLAGWPHTGNQIIRFHEDGTIRKSHGVLTPKYYAKDMKICYEGKEFEFNESFTKLKETTKLHFMTEGVKTTESPKSK
jgi:hypothetical protein